jgi:hypothetical protein
MPDFDRISAELAAIRDDPAMRPMGVLSSLMTLAAGFAIGEGVSLAVRGHAFTSACALASAALLMLPLLGRTVRRRRLRRRLDDLREEARRA